MSLASTLAPSESRRQRGIAIATLCKIKEKDGFWTVPSQSGGVSYTVTLKPPYPDIPMCSCPDYEERGQPCKHVFAVQYLVEHGEDSQGVETVTEFVKLTKQTVAPRSTYKQVWPAYNVAQVNEKHKFQTLLHDLCQGLAATDPAPDPNPKGGRPAVPLADRVFATAFKVYSTVSGRRFSCDLKDACDRGHLSMSPHYNSVFRFLESPELTSILNRLIVQSSLPLRAVERDFAVDSSGFTTSRFVRYSVDVRVEGQPGVLGRGRGD